MDGRQATLRRSSSWLRDNLFFADPCGLPLLRACVFCFCLCLTAALSAPSVHAQEAAQEQYFPITLPLIIDGTPIGEINSQVSMSGKVQLSLSSLKEFLQEDLTSESLTQISKIAESKDFISPEELEPMGIKAAYDPAELMVNISLASDSRAEKNLNLSNSRRRVLRNAQEPEAFSAGMDISFRQSMIHERAGEDAPNLFTPMRGNARGFLRFKKLKPLYVSYEYDFLEGEGWHRVQSTAFYDDEKRAVRYAFGDLTPRTIGFQNAVVIGGASIERQYREIQPFRRTLPGGRSSLILDQRSTVDVIVNGNRAQTLSLAPGKYDVRDFPLVDGINNVTLEIEGDSGEKKTLEYDFFSDAQLLNTELLEFSISAGSIRNRNNRVIHYDGPAVISGFVEKGLNNKTTLAGYGQLANEDFLAGTRIARATEAGLFGLDMAYGGDPFSSGHAMRLSYTWWDRGGPDSNLKDKEVDLSFEILGEDYKSFLAENPESGVDWRLEGRYRTKLPWELSGAVGASHAHGRGEVEHEQRVSFVLSRLFNRIQTSLSGDITREGRDIKDGQLFLSLSMPLGEQQTLRLTGSTDQNTTSAEVSKRFADGTNQWGGRLEYSRNDNQQQASGQLDFTGNRFSADIDHDFVHDFESDDISRQTDLQLSTAIGYAGGKFAIGRKATPGFLIADTHKNLEGRSLSVHRGIGENSFGHTDPFGPILVPVDRKYNVRSFDFEMNDLPVGYNAGPANIVLNPGAFTGYKYVYGSAASITLMARLHDAEDQPLKLATGKLVLQGDDKAAPITFFTNRTGRMVADSIASGTYQLYINDEVAAEITVPDDKVGLYDAGKITIE